MSFHMGTLMSNTRWQTWCNEELYCNNHTDERTRRKYLITELVKEGIFPFLKNSGYEIGCDEHRMAECIARYIYFGQISHDHINDDYRQQDYDHYYYVIDDDAWDNFWSFWSHEMPCWTDIGEDAQKTREGIRFCVWTLLDLYRSKRTDEVDDILGLNEEENEVTDGRDPYLIDSANGYFSAI